MTFDPTGGCWQPKIQMNIAQHLVNLHDSHAVFDFCGGMMFQLVLSQKLRSHLSAVANSMNGQPVVFDAAYNRMARIPGYSQDAKADNIRIFHGREIRKVPNAAGGSFSLEDSASTEKF